MSSQQQYRVLANLHAVDGKERRGFVIIPEGSTVSVVGEPGDLRLVAVRWGDRDVFVFEQDLRIAPEQE